jgi:hypothetical protein
MDEEKLYILIEGQYFDKLGTGTGTIQVAIRAKSPIEALKKMEEALKENV